MKIKHDLYHGMIHLFLYSVPCNEKYEFPMDLPLQPIVSEPVSQRYSSVPYLQRRRLVKLVSDLLFVSSGAVVRNFVGEALGKATFFDHSNTRPLMVKLLVSDNRFTALAEDRVPIALVVQERD